MSKFRTRLRNVGRTTGGFGFAVATQPKPRYILVVAEAADAAAATAAGEAGADAVVLRQGDAATLGALSGKTVAGVWLEDANGSAVTMVRDAGADFFVFDDARASASALTPPEIGRILLLGPDQDAERLRSVSPIDLDAVIVAAEAGTITVRDQLALRRVATLTGAPLLIAAGGAPDTASLEAWRDAGALAVLVSGDAAAVRRVVEAADAVPAPRKREDRDRVTPLIGAPSVAAHSHDDEDDDDGE